jgi:hypothetical protein
MDPVNYSLPGQRRFRFIEEKKEMSVTHLTQGNIITTPNRRFAITEFTEKSRKKAGPPHVRSNP